MSSVQGSTGAVIVSVPVTSVQGNIGAVIVSSVGYAQSAGSAQSASYASSAGGGWPGSLSQFSNNLGNYGAWVPHNTKYGQQRMSGFGPYAGAQGNCGSNPYGPVAYIYMDTGSSMNMGWYHQNCHNCNCNC